MSTEHRSDVSRERSLINSLTLSNWTDQIKIILSYMIEKFGIVADVLNPLVPVWTVVAPEKAIHCAQAAWASESAAAKGEMEKNSAK